jgi:hypothetical protein
LELNKIIVKGTSLTGSITNANYPFVVLIGGPKFLSQKVVYVNMSFGNINGSIIYVNNSANITFTGESTISNIANGVSGFGGGLIISAPWTSPSAIRLSISGVICSNLSATNASSGGLINVVNTNQSILLDGVLMVNVTVWNSTTLGGAVNINAAYSINFAYCNFTNIKAKTGGAIYINNCTNIIFTFCRFVSVESVNGFGGAIFFGTVADFSIQNCLFQLCKSSGIGGALASNSTSAVGLRSIKASNFSGNIGGTENYGNDLADISPTNSSMSYYTTESISQVISGSSSIKFYYNNSNISMDCLLNSSCDTNTVYVSSSGSDSVICGSTATDPCMGVDYGWLNRMSLNSTMYIFNGTFPLNPKDIGITTAYTKIFEGYGFEIDAEISSYPTIYPSNLVSNWIRMSNNYLQTLIFRKIRFLHSTNFSGYMFSPSQPSHYLLLEYCYFTKQNTSTPVISNIINNDYGFEVFLIC